jgi:hypothetical protein
MMGKSKVQNLVSLLKRAEQASRDLPEKIKLPVIFSKSNELINQAKCGVAGHVKALRKTCFAESVETCPQPGPSTLNCRALLRDVSAPLDVKAVGAVQDPQPSQKILVQITGSIIAGDDTQDAALQIRISDVTAGTAHPEPVRARVRQCSMRDSSEFCYKAVLGKLTDERTVLADWTTVAQVDSEWLLLPRKGSRILRLHTYILSCQTGREMTHARCSFAYKNPTLGYQDVQDNEERTKTLAVALAFAVGAIDNRLSSDEVQVIRDWASINIQSAQDSGAASAKLDKAIENAVHFFRHGGQLDTYSICSEVAEIAPPADRYDIVDLCLHVARAKQSVTGEMLAALRDLANWLDVDMDRFRAMLEKTLPASVCQVEDLEIILGLTPNVSAEKARMQLNKEYSKWNARVTNSSPEIQAQADQMLRLIAEARTQYVG